jgi:hypothetical protein
VARTPRPWYRSERAEWCVTIRGQHHKLGRHPDGYPPHRKQRGRWNAPDPIKDRFHELLAAKRTTFPGRLPSPATGLSVAEVFDKYLDWCQKHRSARTYEWYRDQPRAGEAHERDRTHGKPSCRRTSGSRARAAR